MQLTKMQFSEIMYTVQTFLHKDVYDNLVVLYLQNKCYSRHYYGFLSNKDIWLTSFL